MDVTHLGPIRIKHATGGWILRSVRKDGPWQLVKNYGRHTATISATTPTTCAWCITVGGAFLREASGGCDVEGAKSAADDWVAAHRL